jgi:hypothetical protein
MTTCQNNCGRKLGPADKTGLCRSCFNHVRNADPEFQERRRQAMRAKWQTDPEWAERQRARFAALNECPERRAKLSERMRGNELWRRSSYAREVGSPQRMLAGRKGSATKLSHIPGDYRDLYRSLVKKGLTAADAEAAVRHHAEAERQRIRRELQAA